MTDYFVSVRSKDRVSGTPNRYTVRLPCMIFNAHKIDFVGAEIPNTLFTTKIRYMYLSVNGVNYTVPVQPGIYETTDLMTYMSSNIYVSSTYLTTNTPIPANTITFSFNDHLSKIAIVCSPSVTNVTIMVNTDPMFGFNVGSTYAPTILPSVNGIIYGDRLVAMDVPAFVFLTLEELNDGDALNFITSSSTFMPPNIIARIQMNADILHMVNSSPNSFDFVRSMNLIHPVNIDRLSFKFVGPNGAEVDFQGVEHSLLLRIYTDR